MRKRQDQLCGVARFLTLFGDGWTMLMMREALHGTTRFSDFQRKTGAAKNVVSERLSTLVGAGLLEKVEVGVSGSRFAYQLTARGRSIEPVLAAMLLWSNDNLFEPGTEPNWLETRDTRQRIRDLAPRLPDGQVLPWEAVRLVDSAEVAGIKRKIAGKPPQT